MSIKNVIDKVQRTRRNQIRATGCHQASLEYKKIIQHYVDVINGDVSDVTSDLRIILSVEEFLKMLIDVVRTEVLVEVREQLLLNPLQTIDDIKNYNFKLK